MSDLETGFDFQENLFILNFASRMLTAVTDKAMLVSMALETIADFGKSPRAALLTLAADGASLTVDSAFDLTSDAVTPGDVIPVAGSPFEGLFAAKQDGVAPLAAGAGAPLPGTAPHAENKQCLMLPIIANSGLILGVVTMETSEDGVAMDDMSYLRLLVTVLSVSLDNARLFSLAMIDALTGLFMRRFYDVRIEEELEKLDKEEDKLCLVIFDIDHFKNVNDTWGHATGDVVLQEFAGLINSNIRQGKDMACRYGGEEFTVIMPDTELDEAFKIIDNIRAIVEKQTFPGIDPPLRITVSAGIAKATKAKAFKPTEIFGNADAALYEAKETGRNQVLISDK